MKTEKGVKSLIVLLETQFDRIVRAISVNELRSNSRLKKKLLRLKEKITTLRAFSIGPNQLFSVEV